MYITNWCGEVVIIVDIENIFRQFTIYPDQKIEIEGHKNMLFYVYNTAGDKISPSHGSTSAEGAYIIVKKSGITEGYINNNQLVDFKGMFAIKQGKVIPARYTLFEPEDTLCFVNDPKVSFDKYIPKNSSSVWWVFIFVAFILLIVVVASFAILAHESLGANDLGTDVA